MPRLTAAKNNIPTPLQTRSQRMLRCGRCHILPPKKYITHSRYTAAQKGAAICFCTRYCVSLKNYYLGLYEKSMPNTLTLEEKLRQAKASGLDETES